MREPSIHITKSTLEKLIRNHILSTVSSKAINQLMLQARKEAIETRSINITTKKAEKEVTRRTQSSLGDANLLADIIYSTRVKLKHVGVSKIKQTDPQWAQIKDLVPTVDQFCEKYNLQQRDGYVQFVNTALKLLSTSKRANYNYCASWMNQKVDWIISRFESEYQVSHDKHPQYTQEICNIYTTLILDKTGISENYFSDPIQFYHFIQARELADEIGVDYETFIRAQFSALEFCNGIPRIEDLHSDKAKQRVISYMSKHQIVAEPITTSKTDWGKFKK